MDKALNAFYVISNDEHGSYILFSFFLMLVKQVADDLALNRVLLKETDLS